MQNIQYKTSEIKEYYSSNRHTWNEFYPSERHIIGNVINKAKKNSTILDVGCAAGGLGCALGEHFGISNYTGIDINKPVIEYAKRQTKIPDCNFEFIHGDIADQTIQFKDSRFDVVISLSCVDWNVNLKNSINACWEKVERGGYFALSLRLTQEEGVNDIDKSYQSIHFSETAKKGNEEKANYVVLNVFDALKLLASLKPEFIDVYGYWGKPSDTAVTPYNCILFTVCSIKKSKTSEVADPVVRLNLPVSALSNLNS